MVRKSARARAPHQDHDAVAPAGNGIALVAADEATTSSPLIAQYVALKAQYPEALLLSRVGDFYEAYGADAEDLAASVNIILTAKEAGKGRRVAMAGVPWHNLDHYLARLIRQARVVAIAEQMEPPAPNRLVRREITRVITPGTVLEEHLLAAERNNYLCAIATQAGVTAVASADVSTGTATVSAAENDDDLAAELERAAPSEVVVEDDADIERFRPFVSARCRIAVADAGDDAQVVAGAVLEEFPPLERPAVKSALGLLAAYLTYLRLDGRAIAARAQARTARACMMLDPATRRHLDITSGSGENSRASLLGVLARTKTPMGSRLLARWLCAPLVDVERIRSRHDRVESLYDAPAWRVRLQEALAAIADIERIAQKVSARRAGPKDLAALRDSLDGAARLRQVIREAGAKAPALREGLAGSIDPAPQEALAGQLRAALTENPPASVADGGAIRPEHSPELQSLVDLRTRTRDHLLALEERTRGRTGIKSLKVKYTQAFGYYFEVTRAHAESVPEDFIRRQTLVNAERFTNAELRALEAEILGARSRQLAVERELFDALVETAAAARDALLSLAEAIAEIDVYCSLAQVAGERRYVKPAMSASSDMHVEGGRHPIVEAYGGVDFVPNDCHLDAEQRFLLITGPNMGGKSTYLRQTALLAIMAQTGSFVPASSARLGIVERLFTRIGAGDDIAAGRSTFYVEMAEMALILRRCQRASLLLIDEIGRGTGTTDGLAIAQAVCEHLLGLEGGMPMVLFATHFHELVKLSGAYPVVQNLHVAVAEEPAGPIFSHRLLHGSSSRSYGIAVAKMAGLPAEVVHRAQQIADDIEERPVTAVPPPRRRREGAGPDDSQLKLV
jgi:DNA mismatch repair protein MutS